MLTTRKNCDSKKIEVFDTDTSILYAYGVLELVGTEEKKFLNSTSNPTIANFTNSTLNTKIEFTLPVDSIFNINYYLFLDYAINDLTITESNEINKAGIYNAFIGYTHILINQTVFEIAWNLSSANKLVVLTPITEIIVTIGKGILQTKIDFSLCTTGKVISQKILNLTCSDCAEEYKSFLGDITKLALLNSVTCITEKELKNLFTSLTTKYGTTNC